MTSRLPGRMTLQGVMLLGLAILAGAPGCAKRAESARSDAVRVLGEMGTDPGKFFFPRSAAISGEGDLCVVDRSGRIQWFRPDGSFAFEWKLPIFEKGQPTGINFSRAGELLVADSHYQRILVYEPPAPGRDAPPALRRQWGREGNGEGEFNLVRDVVEDSRGAIYAGDYNGPRDRIEKFSPEGEFLMAWGGRGSGDGQFQRPQGLAVERREDGSELILVADSCNHRVQRFSTDGRFAGTFGRLGSGPGELKYPYGLAAVPAGPGRPAAVYVAEWGNNRIQRFDPDGRPRGSWGGPGRSPGELATPWDVAAGPDGRLWVVDFGNHRLQSVPPEAFR